MASRDVDGRNKTGHDGDVLGKSNAALRPPRHALAETPFVLKSRDECEVSHHRSGRRHRCGARDTRCRSGLVCCPNFSRKLSAQGQNCQMRNWWLSIASGPPSRLASRPHLIKMLFAGSTIWGTPAQVSGLESPMRLEWSAAALADLRQVPRPFCTTVIRNLQRPLPIKSGNGQVCWKNSSPDYRAIEGRPGTSARLVLEVAKSRHIHLLVRLRRRAARYVAGLSQPRSAEVKQRARITAALRPTP